MPLAVGKERDEIVPHCFGPATFLLWLPTSTLTAASTFANVPSAETFANDLAPILPKRKSGSTTTVSSSSGTSGGKKTTVTISVGELPQSCADAALFTLDEPTATNGAARVQVKDTRLAAYLFETILRHQFIMLSCGKLCLDPEAVRNSSFAEGAEGGVGGVDSGKAMDGILAALRRRMNMDEDLWSNTVAAIEAEERKDAAEDAGGGAAALSAQQGPAAGGCGVTNMKTLLEYINAKVKFGCVYSNEGEATPFARSVVRLFRLGPNIGDVVQLLTDKNRYARLVGAVFLRYAVAPEDLFDVCSKCKLLSDATPVSYSEDDVGPCGEIIKRILLEDEVYEAWFPSYSSEIVEKLTHLVEEHMTVATEGGGAAEEELTAGSLSAAASSKGKKQFGRALPAGFTSIAQMAEAAQLLERMEKLKKLNAVFDEDFVGGTVLMGGGDPSGGNEDGKSGEVVAQGGGSGRSRKRPREDVHRRLGEFRVVPDSVYLEF